MLRKAYIINLTFFAILINNTPKLFYLLIMILMSLSIAVYRKHGLKNL